MNSLCECGKYDQTIGNYLWCFYHKGPHPLIGLKKIAKYYGNNWKTKTLWKNK